MRAAQHPEPCSPLTAVALQPRTTRADLLPAREVQEQPGLHSILKDSGTEISSVLAPASVLLLGLFDIHTGRLEEQAGGAQHLAQSR